MGLRHLPLAAPPAYDEPGFAGRGYTSATFVGTLSLTSALLDKELLLAKTRALNNESLLAFHELGRFIRDADPRSINSGSGRRARGSFERLRMQKQRGRNELAKARQFAKLYNMAQLKWICSLGQKLGRPLAKSHVCRLVVVRKRTLRDMLARKCAERAWSVLQLEYEIQKMQPKRAYGGRRISRPLCIGDALARTDQLAKKWIRWAEVLEATDDVEMNAMGELLPRTIRKRHIGITREMRRLQRQVQRHLDR